MIRLLILLFSLFCLSMRIPAEEGKHSVPFPLETVIAGNDRIAVLTVEKLAEDSRFVFMERDSIQISREELRFAESALTQRTLQRRYPHVDLFAVIRHSPTNLPDRLIVFNGKRGIRLASVDLPENPEAAAETVKQSLVTAADLSSDSEKHALAIAALRFVGISPDQRKKIQLLMPEIEKALIRGGKLILLEREELSEVLKERYLTEMSFTAAPACIQLRMEFQQGENPESILAVFRYSDSSGTLLAERQIDNILHRDWEMTDPVPNTLSFPVSDPVRESENLAREADFLRNRNLDYPRQVRLLSAAAVLNPGHEPYLEELFIASVEMLSGRIDTEEQRFRMECRYLLDMAEQLKLESGDSRCFLRLYRFPFVLQSFLCSSVPAVKQEGKQLLQRFRKEYTEALRKHLVPLRTPQSQPEKNAFEELRRNVVSHNATFYADNPELFFSDRFGEMAAFLRYRQTLPKEMRINMRQLESRYATLHQGDNGITLLKYHPEITEILLADPDYDFQCLGQLLNLYRQLQTSGDTDSLRMAVRRWRDNGSAVSSPDQYHCVNDRLWFGGFVQDYSVPRRRSATQQSSPVTASVPSAAPPKKSVPEKSPLTLEPWKIPSSRNSQCHIFASCSDGENLYLYQSHGEIHQVALRTGTSRKLSLPHQPSNNIELMTTNGRYLLLARLNMVKNSVRGATITVFDLENESFWEITDLPHSRIEAMAILGDRIYSAGEMQLFSCDFYGKNRRIELSNRREQPGNELEKMERYKFTSLRPIELLHALLMEVYPVPDYHQPDRKLNFLLYAKTGEFRKLPVENIFIPQPPRGRELIYELYGQGLFRMVLPDGAPEMLINVSERKVAGIPQIRRGGVCWFDHNLIWYQRAAAEISSVDQVRIFDFPWPEQDDTGITYPVNAEAAVVRVSYNRLLKIHFNRNH